MGTEKNASRVASRGGPASGPSEISERHRAHWPVAVTIRHLGVTARFVGTMATAFAENRRIDSRQSRRAANAGWPAGASPCLRRGQKPLLRRLPAGPLKTQGHLPAVIGDDHGG